MNNTRNLELSKREVLVGRNILIFDGHHILCETDEKNKFIFCRIDEGMLDNAFSQFVNFYEKYVTLKEEQGEKIEFDIADITFTESKDGKMLMLTIQDMDLEQVAEPSQEIEMCNPSIGKRVLSLFGRKSR